MRFFSNIRFKKTTKILLLNLKIFIKIEDKKFLKRDVFKFKKRVYFFYEKQKCKNPRNNIINLP